MDLKFGAFGKYFAEGVGENIEKNQTFEGKSQDRSAALGRLVLESLNPGERKILGKIKVIERDSLEVNAYAGINSIKEKVIVVNSNLLSFSYTMVNLWFLHLESPKKSPMLAALAVYKYFPYLGSLPFPNNVLERNINRLKTKANEKDGASGMLKYVTILCMELFIICHEFGHHLLGHLEQTSPISEDPVLGLESVFRRQKEEEFEADLVGLDIYNRIISGNGYEVDEFFLLWTQMMAPQGTLAFDMLFSFFDFIEAFDQSKKLTDKYSSHPSSLERRSRLREVYSSIYGKDNKNKRWAMAKAIEDFCRDNRRYANI